MEEINLEQQLNQDAEILAASRKSLLTSVYYGFVWPIVAFSITIIAELLNIGYGKIIIGFNILLMLCVYLFEYKGYSKLEKHSNPTISLFAEKSKTVTCMQCLGIIIIYLSGICAETLGNEKDTVFFMMVMLISYIVYFMGAIRQLKAFRLLKEDRNIRYWYENYIEKAIWSTWIGYFIPVIFFAGYLIYTALAQANATYSMKSSGSDSSWSIMIIGLIVLKIAQWCMMPYIWKGVFRLPSRFDVAAPEEETENLITDETCTRPIDTTGMASVNRIAGAFMFIFTGLLIYQIPLDTWSVKIMWITAWIAILAGAIRLFNTLKGNGRKGAALWIAATLFCIISVPFDIAHSVLQGIAALSKMTGSGGGSWPAWETYLKWFLMAGSLMYMGGVLLFMSSPAFSKKRSGWIWLLAAFAMSAFKLPAIVVVIPLFVGFYLVIPQLYAGNEKAKHRAEGFILAATGFLYSLLILLNNDTSYIIASFAGLIVWLIGVIKIRSLGNDKKGTGAFITYAILMLIASLFHLMPGLVGDVMSVLLQVPAYIILMIGLNRLSKAGKVLTEEPTGSGLLIFTLFTCLILAFIYLIPFVGEPLSALIFSTLGIPYLIVGWKRALISYPDILYLPLETDNTADIQRSLSFGKHKKLLIITCVIVLTGGITSKMIFSSGSLAETIIQKKDLEVEVNPNYMALLEKLTGNAEIELINALSRRDIPSKLIKKWCDKAVKGDAYSQYVVGIILQSNSFYMSIMDGEGRTFFNDWAAQSRGAIQVGDITDFISGKKTIDMNKIAEADAHKWFEASALQGHPRAQCETGFDYSLERGTPKDEKKAFHWFLKAADSGYARAQSSVSACYRFGLGVEENLQEAFKWCKKAAEQGYSNACYDLSIMYKNGIGTAKDPDKAQMWLQKAADQGDEEAERELNSVEN